MRIKTKKLEYLCKSKPYLTFINNTGVVK